MIPIDRNKGGEGYPVPTSKHQPSDKSKNPSSKSLHPNIYFQAKQRRIHPLQIQPSTQPRIPHLKPQTRSPILASLPNDQSQLNRAAITEASKRRLRKLLTYGIINVCLNPAGIIRTKGNEVSVNDPSGALWRAQTTVLSRRSDRERTRAQRSSRGSRRNL